MLLADAPDENVYSQMQMALGGPLGQLQRGVSDVVSEVEVIAEDPPPPQQWTATSAELWPVRSLALPGTGVSPGIAAWECGAVSLLAADHAAPSGDEGIFACQPAL